MDWLESKEEEADRTIIDLLEKEEGIEAEGAWNEQDETLNLIPPPNRNEQPAGASSHRGSDAPLSKRQSSRKEGKWIRSSKGTGRDSFRWKASATDFDKKATRILQRFWLHCTLSPLSTAGNWAEMEKLGLGALETVADLVQESSSRGLEPNKVRITKVGNEEVTLGHLSTVQRGRWIHSSLLNAWSALISKDAGHVCYGSTSLASHLVWILDSTFYDHLTGVCRDSNGAVTQIKGLDLDRGRRVLRKQNLSNITKVLVPINLNNDHWIVACMDKEKRSISTCDSLGGQHPEVIRNLTA
eukprot:1333864-Rhodomonas_salina.1